MKKSFQHIEPLFILSKKENESNKRINEQIFYPQKLSHKSASSILLSLSKKLKFLLLLIVVSVLALLTYLFLGKSNQKPVDDKNANNSEVNDLHNDDKSDTAVINDSVIEPEK